MTRRAGAQPPSRLRILVDDEKLNPSGGTERSVLEVSTALAEHGHRLHLAYRDQGSFLPSYQQFCDTTTRVPGLTIRRPGAAVGTVRLLASVGRLACSPPSQLDIVYTNLGTDLPFGWLMSRIKRTAHVAHLRLPPDLIRWPAVYGRLADRYIAVSNRIRDLAMAVGLDAERIEVVHNGLDPAAWPAATDGTRARARQELGLPPDALLIGCFGRVVEEKGIHVLMRALARLDLEATDARLVVAGDRTVGGPTGDSYRRRLTPMAPPGCIWMPNQLDVVPLYHAVDVVVVPSIWEEPCSRVVLEAMACGRPVVASRVGGVPEILTGHFAALLTAPDDDVMLGHVLSRVLEWRNSWPALGPMAHDHIGANFTLAATVNGIEDCFRRALEEPYDRLEPPLRGRTHRSPG
jgi:glycosyltransferase involved in cell wall biosynthesis